MNKIEELETKFNSMEICLTGYIESMVNTIADLLNIKDECKEERDKVCVMCTDLGKLIKDVQKLINELRALKK